MHFHHCHSHHHLHCIFIIVTHIIKAIELLLMHQLHFHHYHPNRHRIIITLIIIAFSNHNCICIIIIAFSSLPLESSFFLIIVIHSDLNHSLYMSCFPESRYCFEYVLYSLSYVGTWSRQPMAVHNQNFIMRLLKCSASL